MILLEAGNRVLAETVAQRVKPSDPTAKREPLLSILCDFDDVAYKVEVDKAALNLIKVSMSMPFFNQIKNLGVSDVLATTYKDMVGATENGYDVTLHIDLDKLPGTPDDVIQKVKMLKTNVVGAPFARYLGNILKSGAASLEAAKFSLRQDTNVFLVSGQERATIIFGIDFRERVDLAVAKIFLHEFEDARRHLQAAPPCTFSANPPAELKQFGITEPQGQLGFLSFAILKSHVDNNKLDRVVAALQNFRTYLQYHIKCSKTYFHARMRARVVSLLKVLNRAKQDQGDQPKRLMSGKYFKQKA
jgi:actin related protein 2/3 complex subunit 2